MAFLWTGSQIPVYFFGKTEEFTTNREFSNVVLTGGIPPYVYGDIGGTDRWVWLVRALHKTYFLELMYSQLYCVGACKPPRSRWRVSLCRVPI